MNTITTVQWNIGGAKIRKSGDDAQESSSYKIDGLQSIVAELESIHPDIVTLQEVHGNDERNQVETIADALGLPYHVQDYYADSHLEAGQRLGQAIISRFPISGHTFKLFYNPNTKALWPGGRTVASHDKGITSCNIQLPTISLNVKTLHLIPFRRFAIDTQSLRARDILLDVQSKLSDNGKHVLIQGDFNLDFISLQEVLPVMFDLETKEIPQNAFTRADQRRLDHVIYRGLTFVDSRTIDTVLTDHYPVVSRFSSI